MRARRAALLSPRLKKQQQLTPRSTPDIWFFSRACEQDTGRTRQASICPAWEPLQVAAAALPHRNAPWARWPSWRGGPLPSALYRGEEKQRMGRMQACMHACMWHAGLHASTGPTGPALGITV